MQYRRLGRSGLQVSVVGLGCNNFGGRVDLAGARTVVDRALDLGVTLFDTADAYGRGASESILGEILGERRKHAVIATKFAGSMDQSGLMRGASRRYVISAVEASLRRLRTDWIDLYQIHHPDPATPMEETLRALDDLVRAGKVRYIGNSNFAGWQVADAEWLGRQLGCHRFVSCQNEYSLLVRRPEGELFAAMEAYGLGLLPYLPLAGGFLSGKYRRDHLPEGARLTNSRGMADRYLTDANWAIVERLEAFGAERGHTLLDVAFAWLASRPVASSVIAGATRPEQVEQNVRAAEWTLTPEERAEVDRISDRG